jgi:hypothetical protein
VGASAFGAPWLIVFGLSDIVCAKATLQTATLKKRIYIFFILRNLLSKQMYYF